MHLKKYSVSINRSSLPAVPHQNSCGCRHHGTADPEKCRGAFTEDQKRKQHSQKRRGGVECGGFCRAEPALGENVEVDAQSVSDKAEQKHGKNAPRRGKEFTGDEGDDQRAGAGAEAFDHCGLRGVTGGERPRAVVFKSPADTRAENEQCTGAECHRSCSGCHRSRRADTVSAAVSGDAEHHTRGGHKRDGKPCRAGDFFAENAQRDNRCGDDLKIVEQGSACRITAFQTQHEQDRRGDVEDNHSGDIRKFFLCDGRVRRTLGIQDTDETQTDARTEIQKRRHHRSADGTVRKQQLGKRRVQRIQRGGKQGKENVRGFHGTETFRGWWNRMEGEEMRATYGR